AGSRLDRAALLRGRRLVVSDGATGGGLGRRLTYLSVERHDPLVSASLGRLALATFVDAAQARQRLTLPGPSEVHVDVGAGLRAAQAGDDTVIRLDLAVGLRDGRMRVSAGSVTRWGRP